MRSLIAAILVLSSLVFGAPPAGAQTVTPTEASIDKGSWYYSGYCQLSNNGEWAVYQQGGNDPGNIKLTHIPSFATVELPFSETQYTYVSDNGQFVTVLSFVGSTEALIQYNLAAGTAQTVVGAGKHVSSVEVSADGSRISWIEQDMHPGGGLNGPSRFMAWQRSTNARFSIGGPASDVRGLERSSLDGRYRAVHLGSAGSDDFKVWDTDSSQTYEVTYPPSEAGAELLGLNSDGSRFLWYRHDETTQSGRMVLTNRTGQVLSATATPLVAFNDLINVRIEGFLSSDATSAVALGIRKQSNPPETVAIRWLIGSNRLEEISIPGLIFAGDGGAILGRGSSFCDASPDLRFLLGQVEAEGGGYELARFDLSGAPAPTKLTVDMLGGPQLTDQVTRLYSAYFNRAPDQSGLAFWRTRRATGTNLASISQLFTESTEFINTYGNLTNPEFVNLVYQNVLGRSPDADGAAFWTNALNGGLSRGAVMIGFSESDEFINTTGTRKPAPTAAAQIDRLYRAYFKRAADEGGLNFWNWQFTQGATLADTSNQFAASTEFTNTYGALTNAEFVSLVYQNVLGRSPDADGAAFWTNALNGGLTRGAVMISFSESAEFILKTDSIPPA